MAIDVVQCNPWEDFVSPKMLRDDINSFQGKLKQYYLIEENLPIYQMQKIEHPLSNDPGFYGYSLCEACGCYGGFTFATLIDAKDVDRAKNLRFYELETAPSERPR